MTAHGSVTSRLRWGISVGVLYWLSLLFFLPAWAWAAGQANRLPDSPEIPDLYDPAIVSTYAVVAQRP
jgi:hypothetical protein